MASNIRLFLDHELASGQSVALTQPQAHYLFGVMRQRVGAAITVFNGKDGAWRAEVKVADKRKGVLLLADQTAPQQMPPDLWLLFAPIKKARTDFIVEKATEMGAARICPVQTNFTNADRIRQDRLQAHAVEAAEQCGGTFVPPVENLTQLSKMLTDWPDGRQLMFCDETLSGDPTDLPAIAGPWAILIGPEGGFSEVEREHLRALPLRTLLPLAPEFCALIPQPLPR